MSSRTNAPAAAEPTERGKRASFDPETGEVSGSGAGAGDPGSDKEDYDDDTSIGSGGTHKGGGPANSA